MRADDSDLFKNSLDVLKVMADAQVTFKNDDLWPASAASFTQALNGKTFNQPREVRPLSDRRQL